MMKDSSLIIFIDALPYYYKDTILQILNGVNYNNETIPEIGYSSNQHCSIFSGMLPDDVGYFTDWTLNLDKKEKLKFYIKHNNIINPVVNYMLNKAKLAKGNIPLGMKRVFCNKGLYPLKDISVLSNLNDKFNKYKIYQTTKIDELNMLDDLSSKQINDHSLVVLNSIDHLGHIVDMTSLKYQKHMEEYLVKVQNVIVNFKNKYGDDSRITVLSDHGMTPINQTIKLDLEKEFGKQSSDTYVYFLDSVVCKVWTFNHLESEISTYLASLPGKVLDSSERDYFGIESKEFGDIIFILDSGYIFSPNYFGHSLRGDAKGMHGYIPSDFYQHGILITNYKIEDRPLLNREISDYIYI